ncbi:cyclin domain-containing protein [Diplocarpon rosae]|nr:cyclin domain-containing protein [Diplocarpon rosae]
MSHLSNPLATPHQLHALTTLNHPLPPELQDSIRFHTARLTQAAGLLLRLPQNITAQANVLLFRFWTVEAYMKWEFSGLKASGIKKMKSADVENHKQDVSAATLFLTAKISAQPRSPRSITNVYAYLLSPSSPLSSLPPDINLPAAPDNPEQYYLSESTYHAFRTRILLIEGQLLNALGFNMHVALPHPLAITYLQALDLFSSSSSTSPGPGPRVAKRAIAHLNTALLSPQMLYLTHQPPALATAAVYLAARDEGVRLPESEWWEVFDCEREELGFLVVGMGSVAAVAERWKGKGMITRRDVEALSGGTLGGEGVADEEEEMARLLDEKVGA